MNDEPRDGREAPARIGWAALTAANEAMPHGTREILDLVLGEDSQVDAFDKMAAFVRIAGDIGGEPLFRWMAGRNLHPLPPDSYASADPAIRLWFEAFVATARALWPIIDPRPNASAFVAPRVVGDERFEKIESRDPPRPETTAGISVVRHYDASAGSAALVPGANIGASIGAAALADFATGRIPTNAELQAMTPEERRGYAHLFGKGSDVAALEAQVSDPNARLGDAPPADALEPMAIDRAGVAGTVAVGTVKNGAAK